MNVSLQVAADGFLRTEPGRDFGKIRSVNTQAQRPISGTTNNMKRKLQLAAAVAVTLANAALLQAQSTAFTYQGRLNDGVNPANGTYDFRFTIYDALSGGNPVGGALTNATTSVGNGLFTVTLDFGAGAFPGAGRWLEIGVRTNGAAAFTTISPRQALASSPYAITAGNVVSGGIAGTYGNAVTFSNPANNFTGAFIGNGAAVSNVNAATLGGLSSSNFWRLSGNNVSAGQFLGSTNNQALELRADGLRALRLEPNGSGFVNVIGGALGNSVAAGISGATISGGGAPTNSFFFAPNTIAADFGTIGGGNGIRIGANSFYSTIGGGIGNDVGTNSGYSTVSGGYDNNIGDSSQFATIPGGDSNAATNHAFAAGHRAKANHTGAFVWADATEADFASSGANQFLVRASGGVGINASNPGATLDVNGSLRVGNGTVFNDLQGGLAQMATDSTTVKTNFTFAFPRAFSTVPNVIVSARNVPDVDDTFAVTVRRVTTTTCTVNVVRVDTTAGWGQHVRVNWVAWE